MAEYHVVWEIDIQADSPQHAANLSLEIHRDARSLANHFTVTEIDGDGKSVEVNAGEPEIRKASGKAPTR